MLRSCCRVGSSAFGLRPLNLGRQLLNRKISNSDLKAQRPKIKGQSPKPTSEFQHEKPWNCLHLSKLWAPFSKVAREVSQVWRIELTGRRACACNQKGKRSKCF